MPTAEEYVCPNCGGVVSYQIEQQRLVCEHCGHVFAPGEHEQDIPLDESVEVTERRHVESAAEFLQRAPWKAPREGDAGIVLYSCPTCAARILADQANATATCPYCGNNLLLSGIAQPETIPQRMLPFKVTRERALELLRAHCTGKIYLPRDFDLDIEHVQGVYVPYYLYDVHVHGAVGYVGYMRKALLPHRPALAVGEGYFQRIPVDTSSRMPDAHMDAIAPFSFDKLEPFSVQNVAGHLMEVPDESPERSEVRAQELARGSFESTVTSPQKRIVMATSIESVPLRDLEADTIRSSLCALPVWLLHGTWKGRDYLFAVNGETGTCVGDLPVNKGLREVLLFLVTPLVCLFLLWVVMTNPPAKDPFRAVISAVLLPVMLANGLDRMLMAEMHTAVKATNSMKGQIGQSVQISSECSRDRLSHCAFEGQAIEHVKEAHAAWVEEGRPLRKTKA